MMSAQDQGRVSYNHIGPTNTRKEKIMDKNPCCVHCVVSSYIRQHRAPTWCEMVSALAAAVGALVNLIQLLKG